MKIKLKSYNDLGRCSLGTLIDEFDTDTYEIHENGKTIHVNSVEDLFPYLWQNPGISGHNGERKFAFFNDKGTHWHHDFDKSIKDYKMDILKLRKKIANTEKPSLVAKYERELEHAERQVDSITKMLERLDAEMEEQKKKLIEDNQ